MVRGSMFISCIRFWRELTSSERTGDLDPNKKRSDTFMLANGYLFHNGAWIHSEDFSG